MRILDTYIGIEPFTVKVDQSPELEALIEKARELRQLPFAEKLAGVKELSIDALVNAYEEMLTGNVEAGNIVCNKYSLNHALQEKLGCCRYQGALFFVLGYEAELGDKQFISFAEVGNLNTVFNEVFEDGRAERVSIFTESLKNKDKYDYSKHANWKTEQVYPGLNFYSYQKTPKGMVIVENENRQVDMNFKVEPQESLDEAELLNIVQ